MPPKRKFATDLNSGDESRVQERDTLLNTADAQNVLQEEEQEDEKNLWLKYAKLILPHLGLIILSCLYVVAGAAVFYRLEKPNELKTRDRNLHIINAEKASLLEKLWNLSEDNIDRWRQIAADDVENMTRTLLDAFDTPYIETRHLNETSEKSNDNVWTFSAAIFFTSTLLTTIGYGNLVPVTFEGRLFCICYGLFGVPLILITVTDIGKFFAEHFTIVYNRYLKWKRTWWCCGAKQRLPSNNNNNDDNVNEKRHLSANAGDGQQRQEQREEENENANNTNSDNNELKKLGLGSLTNIPTPVILGILLGYMALGALLLSVLEEWEFFDAFYFSFITMTTVGFGDLVPENQRYFLLDLLYIVVGLAITTMCIDLVGAQYIEKIHYFGMAIQDARIALVNVGGKMVQVGDLKKYAAFLHKKYGLNASVKDTGFASRFPHAFTPREIQGIRYIDFVRSSDSLHSCYSNSKSSHEEGEEDKRWRATYGLE